MALAKEQSGAFVVLGIGLVQVGAGLFAPERILEMVASGAILLVVGAILFTWRSVWAWRVALAVMGAAGGVFFVLMLRAPREVPRTLILGLAAAFILTIMNRPGAEERE